MGRKGDDCYCDNCGEYLGKVDYSSNTFGHAPANAVRYNKGGFLGFMVTELAFCGDRCKREWKANNE